MTWRVLFISPYLREAVHLIRLALDALRDVVAQVEFESKT